MPTYVDITDEQTRALADMVIALKRVPSEDRVDTIGHFCRLYCEPETRERFWPDEGKPDDR